MLTLTLTLTLTQTLTPNLTPKRKLWKVLKKVKKRKGKSPRWQSNWKAMAYQTWSITAMLWAAHWLHDKVCHVCHKPDMGRLQHKCNRLRSLANCSVAITNKQNHNVINYDYIESNRDYIRDYIGLETFSEGKQTPRAWYDISIFSDNIRY